MAEKYYTSLLDQFKNNFIMLANFNKKLHHSLLNQSIKLICSVILLRFLISSERKLFDKTIFDLFIFNLIRFFFCLSRNIFKYFKTYWFFLVKQHSHHSCLRLSSSHFYQVVSLFVALKAKREYPVLIMNVILFSILLYIRNGGLSVSISYFLKMYSN